MANLRVQQGVTTVDGAGANPSTVALGLVAFQYGTLSLVGVTPPAQFLWTSAGPPGSTAVLSHRTDSVPTLYFDQPGDWLITLEAKDSGGVTQSVYTLPLSVVQLQRTAVTGPLATAFCTPAQVETPSNGAVIFQNSTAGGSLYTKDSGGNVAALAAGGGGGAAAPWKTTARLVATTVVTHSGPQTVDGIAAVPGDVVLDATFGSASGLYTVQSGAWTRTPDMNSSQLCVPGSRVHVSEGTVNANTDWYLATPAPITLGATALNFQQFDSTFDVRRFGAKGIGIAHDDTSAINAASLAASNAGGGEVFFPAGTYWIGAQINLYDKVAYSGVGEATTVTAVGYAGVAGTDFPNGGLFYGEGSSLLLDGLAGSVARGASTMTLSSDQSSHLAAGDDVIIYDSADFSFSSEQSIYHAGEYLRLLPPAGAVLALCSPTLAGYTAGANIRVHKLNPIHCSVSNMRISGFGTDSIALIKVVKGADCNFEGLLLSGSDFAMISYQVGVRCNIDNVRSFDHTAYSGTNYAIGLANVQDCHINRCDLVSSRTVIDIGGGSYPLNVPNRNVLISNCHPKSNGIGSLSSAGMHGNSEFITYRNCTLKGGYLAGDNNTLADCRIFSGDNVNSAIYLSALLGLNHTVANCDIFATGNVDTSYGLVSSVGATPCDRTGGTFRIVDCRIHMGPFSGHPIKINNGTANNDISVEISNTSCDADTPGVAGSVVVYNVAGHGFRRLVIDGLRLTNLGLRLDGPGAETLLIDDCKIMGSGVDGILKQPNASSPWASEYMRIHGCTVLGSTNAGMLLTGDSATTSILELSDNTSLNNSATPYGSAADASFYASTWGTAVFGRNVVGDTRAVQKQTRSYGADTIGQLEDRGQIHVGAYLPNDFSGGGVTRFNGREVHVVGGGNEAGRRTENRKPAANGAQQWAPGVSEIGQGWKTNATAASQACEVMTQVQTVQGAAAPTFEYHWLKQINLGGYVTVGHFTSAGAWVLPLTLSVGSTMDVGSTMTVGGFLNLTGSGNIATVGRIRGDSTLSVVARDSSNTFNLVLISANGSDDVLMQGVIGYIDLVHTGVSVFHQQVARFEDSTGTARFVFDCNSQLCGVFSKAATPAAQAADYGSLGDTTGGTPASSVVDVTTGGLADPVKCNNNFKTIRDYMQSIRAVLQTHGWMA